jgi:acyl-coenzyme A synthetase/AMP-(fatty) acid ligase
MSVLQSARASGDLVAFCEENLPTSQVPLAVQVSHQLPTTITGKVLRAALRKGL